MYYSSEGQLVDVDEVEMSEGPKLFNDAIGEWPNYIYKTGPTYSVHSN